MRKVISEFFLDSAKIVFGSMVIGFFAPNVYGLVPWKSLAGGLTATATLLILASITTKKETQ